MSDAFTLTIQFLDSIGFFKFVIPYILTFAIFYGLLRKSQIFGERKEAVAINATIALSASLLVTAAPILAGIDISTALSQFLAFFLVILVIILVLVFIPLTIYGKSLSDLGLKGWNSAIVIIVIIAVAVLIATGLLLGPFLNFFGAVSEETLYSIVTLGIFLAIMLAILFFPSKKQS
ncbi:MAG: hypothetical protein QXQ14_00940 [Candidatus Aenigmatarchaeota archaeon]